MSGARWLRATSPGSHRQIPALCANDRASIWVWLRRRAWRPWSVWPRGAASAQGSNEISWAPLSAAASPRPEAGPSWALEPSEISPRPTKLLVCAPARVSWGPPSWRPEWSDRLAGSPADWPHGVGRERRLCTANRRSVGAIACSTGGFRLVAVGASCAVCNYTITHNTPSNLRLSLANGHPRRQARQPPPSR